MNDISSLPLFRTRASRRQLLLGSIVVIAASLSTGASAESKKGGWGSYLTPFRADSLWNSRPVDPKFGDFVIPQSSYSPQIAEGKFSTGVYLGKSSDPAMVVEGPPGRPGVWDPDAEATRSVTIPHWPADTIPAEGSDGHADIVDEELGVIHSFFKLRKKDDKWTAAQYAWTRLDGTGWGDPAHYFQGARAAGVATSAGIIRKHEIDDGQAAYSHALAMSLTYNGLSPDPAYIFPATSADRGAERNTGKIPEGALLMLPESYDTSAISSPKLKKVAETLKRHGAYVVDRNDGTPFAIYVENGSGFSLHGPSWNVPVARELDRIRANLRQVISAREWRDGNDKVFDPQKRRNLLSMRGPWVSRSGKQPGTYMTLEQALVFPASDERQVMVNRSSRGLNVQPWARPKEGEQFRLTAEARGGASMKLEILTKQGAVVYDSGELFDGESVKFTWPADETRVVVSAVNGIGKKSSVRGNLVQSGTSKP